MTAATIIPKPYKILGSVFADIAADEAAGRLTPEQAERERFLAECDAYNEMRDL